MALKQHNRASVAATKAEKLLEFAIAVFAMHHDSNQCNDEMCYTVLWSERK